MAYTKTNWVNGTTPLNDKNMNKIENALENLDTNISKSTDEYSSTRTYSIGELVIYNNKLYKANQDITTAEAFNSSHWTEVTLLSDVNEIKSVVNNNADNLNKLNEGIDAKANIDDVYTKTQLDDNLLPMRRVLGSSLGDSSSITISINKYKPYIFINSHVWNREIVLITFTPSENIINADRILGAGSSELTSFTLNDNKLTIKSSGRCRGVLYELSYQVNA